MVCDPSSISDNGKKITYGNWEASFAYLYNKDGTQLVESNTFELKQDQGPFKPLPEKKEEEQEANSDSKPFLFKNVKNCKLYQPNLALSSKDKARGTAQKPMGIRSLKPASAIARRATSAVKTANSPQTRK